MNRTGDLRIFILFALVAGAFACSDDPGNPDSDSETHWEGDPKLPALESPGDVNCRPTPEDGWIYELSEWIGTGEGLIIGDVVEVEPATDLAWAPDGPGGEPGLYQVAECTSSIEPAFSVRLENVAGYLHDQELPDELTIHFGQAFRVNIPDEQMIEVDENGVTWPDEETGVFEGMRIGGVVFQEPEISNRWSFRINKFPQRRMFQVSSGELTFQDVASGENAACGWRAPFDQIEEMGEDGLLDEITELQNDDELYVAPSDREDSVHRFPWYGDNAETRSSLSWTDWVGACSVRPDEPEVECSVASDCEDDNLCIGGDCVECAADADCEHEKICHGGECISDG